MFIFLVFDCISKCFRDILNFCQELFNFLFFFGRNKSNWEPPRSNQPWCFDCSCTSCSPSTTYLIVYHRFHIWITRMGFVTWTRPIVRIFPSSKIYPITTNAFALSWGSPMSIPIIPSMIQQWFMDEMPPSNPGKTIGRNWRFCTKESTIVLSKIIYRERMQQNTWIEKKERLVKTMRWLWQSISSGWKIMRQDLIEKVCRALECNHRYVFKTKGMNQFTVILL